MRGYFTQALPLMIEFTLWAPTRLDTSAEDAISCLMSSCFRHLCSFSLYLCSKTVSENVSSELCHEPNMTRSPSGDGSLSPQLATEAYYIVPQGRQSHTEHMAGTDSVLLAPSHVSADKSDRPRDVARRCADIDDPRTPDVCSGNQSNVTSHAGFRRDSERDGHPEVGEPCSEQGDNSPESNVDQQPGVTASKKLERQEDIVARNKMTLGRNAFPGGSYTMAYAHKQGRAHNGKQVR